MDGAGKKRNKDFLKIEKKIISSYLKLFQICESGERDWYELKLLLFNIMVPDFVKYLTRPVTSAVTLMSEVSTQRTGRPAYFINDTSMTLLMGRTGGVHGPEVLFIVPLQVGRSTWPPGPSHVSTYLH